MELDSPKCDFVIFAKSASGAAILGFIGILVGICSKINGKRGFQSGKWCQTNCYAQKHPGKHFGGMGELAGGTRRAKNSKLNDFRDLMSLIRMVVSTMTETVVVCRLTPNLDP